MSERPEHWAWLAMKQRCHNPNATSYAWYGARGIEVCDRWRNDFATFLNDVGPRPSPLHSLDRINYDGDYEPTNVRWATKSVQANNTRGNVTITRCGQTHTIAEWANITGIKVFTLYRRIQNGWSAERALTTLP